MTRVDSLTGVRAVAALLVVLTHAAFTTGKYTQTYVGLMYARAEIGVPIFFVLSGFLLFSPWVKALARADAEKPYEAPSVQRYAWHRVRRIMPAYVVTVLAAYALYHFRTAGPNPGHSWLGLLRNLTLTQIYTDNYLFSWLHQGLTQMWSLAVEVAFYVALPALAYLLMVVLCRRRWRPGLLLGVLGFRTGDEALQPGFHAGGVGARSTGAFLPRLGCRRRAGAGGGAPLPRRRLAGLGDLAAGGAGLRPGRLAGGRGALGPCGPGTRAVGAAGPVARSRVPRLVR